jgi:hypothetical protein
MDLEDELERVAAELGTALTEQARLSARIAGLQAESDALVRALGASAHAETPDWQRPLSAMTKADAIVAVLRSADHPLSIGAIVEALKAGGRNSESYNGISVYLQDLLSRGRVERPSRGLYVAA